jgi:hypothetical protein
MKGENQSGVSTISLGRMQYIRQGTAGPTERRKVNVKFTLEQATKAQRGSRGIALLFI